MEDQRDEEPDEGPGLKDRIRGWIGGTREDQLLLQFVAVGVFIDTMSTGMVTPILPAFAQRFSLSQASITALLTLRGAAAIFFSAPVGFLVQNLGHRNMLLASLSGTVVASVFLAVPATWHFLAVALFLQGTCSEIAWSTGLSLAAYVYGKGGPADENREVGMGGSSEEIGGHDEKMGRYHTFARGVPLVGSEANSSGEAYTSGDSTRANGGEGGGGRRASNSSSSSSSSSGKSDGFAAGDNMPRAHEPLLGSGTKVEANGEESPTRSSEEASGLVGAIGVLFSMASLGYLIGPFAGAVVYQYTTTWMPFALVTLTTLVITLALLVLTSSENLFVRKLTRVGDEDGVAWGSTGVNGIHSTIVVKEDIARRMEPLGERVNEDDSLLTTLYTVGKDRTIAAMLIVTIVSCMAMGAVEVILPFHLTGRCGMNTAQVGLIFVVIAVTFGVAARGAEHFVQLVGPIHCINIGLLAQALVNPMAVLPGVSCRLVLECIFMGLAGVAMAFNGTPCFPLMVDVLDELGFQSYAVAVSLYNTSYTIGSALGPLVTASLIAYVPAHFLIGFTSVFMLLCIPIAWWGRR